MSLYSRGQWDSTRGPPCNPPQVMFGAVHTFEQPVRSGAKAVRPNFGAIITRKKAEKGLFTPNGA